MIELVKSAVVIENGVTIKEDGKGNVSDTMTYSIMSAHNTGDEINLKIKFDAMASHDITYVGIIQTAKASGMKEFPLPYVLTNCHNSLCAVGGTINEDDHVFGLSAAKKYGGIFVPPHMAVIHQYMREAMTGCGKMILGSDSHTRYGALGTMAVGEGGPELVKQLMKKTYDLKKPDVIAVYLEGKPMRGVGPQDVALTLIKAVFKNGFVKNKVLEFVGPGIANLSMDYRNGIDVMTTETTCLSSIWMTDEIVKEYYANHGRLDAFKLLSPGKEAQYDGMVKIDLSKVVPMIALPFHPSNVYTIDEFNSNAMELLKAVEAEFDKSNANPFLKLDLVSKVTDKGVLASQGIIAGCAGGLYENIMNATEIINTGNLNDDAYALSVYPASEAVHYALLKNGAAADLVQSGVTMKTAFCGPCFGAGDVPANMGLSIRHTTRNFPNREGSKPSDGQISTVALMDAMSIAASSINGGIITPATEIDFKLSDVAFSFNSKVYEARVYQGTNEPKLEEELVYGPNIKDWPEIEALNNDIILKMVTVIDDEVTTTDELIPSGETSSLRSNPLKLAEYTLSRKDPAYVGEAKVVKSLEDERKAFVKDGVAYSEDLKTMIYAIYGRVDDKLLSNVTIGSVIYANKPGDGSAREQAASCQKVLGGLANICKEYATKRYRSNVINWGMLPFTLDAEFSFEKGDLVHIKGIKAILESDETSVDALVVRNGETFSITLLLDNLSSKNREIILDGCLMNNYKKSQTN